MIQFRARIWNGDGQDFATERQAIDWARTRLKDWMERQDRIIEYRGDNQNFYHLIVTNSLGQDTDATAVIFSVQVQP